MTPKQAIEGTVFAIAARRSVMMCSGVGDKIGTAEAQKHRSLKLEVEVEAFT